MSARRLSMVSSSTLRGLSLGAARGGAALPVVATLAEGRGGDAEPAVERGFGAVLGQPRSARSSSAEGANRMGGALLLGLNLAFQAIQLAFQILLGNAVLGVFLGVLGSHDGGG